jgi:transposase
MHRRRHHEFVRFLNAIEAQVTAGKIVHITLDNYAHHKHPKVRQQHPKVRQCPARHSRFIFHLTPTSCSWLNAIKGFFAKLTKRRLKREIPIRCRPPGNH